MVWAVSTTVVDTVWTTLRKTYGLDIVTGDVIRDIQRATVAKVNEQISEYRLCFI